MDTALAVSLLLAGLTAAAAAATAAQVLHEFARHELEEYCHLRQRREWFDAIIRNREHLALAAESVQMLAITATWMGMTLLTAPRLNAAPLDVWRWLLTVSALFLLLLVANSWIPWGIAHRAAAPFLFYTWRLWWLVSRVTWPLTGGVRLMAGFAGRLTGESSPPPAEDEEQEFELEIRSMASEGERDGWLASRVRRMLEGVLDLDDTLVGKVMTPRSRVDAIEVRTDWEEMARRVVELERTRFPVYRSQLDNVLGILYTKDLLPELLKPPSRRRRLVELLRKPISVPLTTRLDEMLSRFLQSRVHLAIVHDEYDAVAGIVTIEDILEEIVGEIEDETDERQPPEVERISDHESRAAGFAHLETINQQLGVDLPEDEDFDTISGLLMSRLNDVPTVGQRLVEGNVEIEVLEATPRYVKLVKLTRLQNIDRPLVE